METIFERLDKLVKYKNLSARAFALKIGTSSQVFGKYLKDRAPSYDVLSVIIETFDDISAEWLLTGKGEMLKTEKPITGSLSANETKLWEQIEFLRDHVASQQRQLETQARTIEMLAQKGADDVRRPAVKVGG